MTNNKNKHKLPLNLSMRVWFALIVILSSNASAEIIPLVKPIQTSRAASSTKQCVPVASWVIPGKNVKTSFTEIASHANQHSVILLGETHVNREHHRWQLQMLAALHTIRPDMIIGFEMFPRSAQKALDQWIAGELSESDFLQKTNWNSVWGTDASLYLPLFHFARMNRIPMRALNIDSELRRRVSEKGFDSVPENEREGVTRPAPPSAAYLDFLLPIYELHDRKHKQQAKSNKYDPDFLRFVVGQQLWDRAMAQEIKAALDLLEKRKNSLVVGIMGTGHILHGFGVPHQLKDLGVNGITTLIPWDTNKSCKQLTDGYADAVFGLTPQNIEAPPSFQRLGIRYEMMVEQGGARVMEVEKASIAESAGLLTGDIIREIAGVAVKDTNDIVTVVKRQAPGTWLPISIERGKELKQIIAKFPALAK
ncbi:MAG: ChaN family lipoprotein [Nitrosomonas sp.]|nr:ChaN family lipoprotein [Nitrosomonas sp.]